MATYTVHFVGLICHIGSDIDSKKHAALIKDPMGIHVPYIIVNKQATPLQNGDTITISTSAAANSKDADFHDLVSHLREETDAAALGGTVGSANDFNLVNVYFKYPGGDLTVAQYYPYAANYDVSGKDHCVPRVVALTYMDGDPGTIVITHKDSSTTNLTIRPADCIILGNTELFDDGRDHFFIYLGITNGTKISKVKEISVKCPKLSNSCIQFLPPVNDRPMNLRAELRVQPLLQNPECSNSQWP